MSKPHPLCNDLIKFAKAPDEWQWQASVHYPSADDDWFNVTFEEAIRAETLIRLVPKRSLIPADRLPEGWEVERIGAVSYHISTNRGLETDAIPVGGTSDIRLLWQLLRHIDPETNDE